MTQRRWPASASSEHEQPQPYSVDAKPANSLEKRVDADIEHIDLDAYRTVVDSETLAGHGQQQK